MIKKKNHRRWEPRIRINYYIRTNEVRVIDNEGKQIGIMKTKEAVKLAKGQGLDLVEVSASAKPHVCKICDFGKYKYEQSKKKKKTTSVSKTKEIQIRPHCDDHDFNFKLAHAIDFLCSDMKVKIVLKFRGRENAHKEFGFDIIKRFLNKLKPYGKADSDLRSSGRSIIVFVSPLPKKQRGENPHNISS